MRFTFTSVPSGKTVSRWALSTNGALTVSDADAGESRFQVVNPTQGLNSYGAFSIETSPCRTA